MFTLFSANLSRLFIYAGFELNKKYIAENLCVNRDKPWLHCNGKCYFMKKIKQAEDNKNAQERQNQKNLFQEAFCNVPVKIKFHTTLLAVIPIPNNRIKLPVQSRSIFQPPRLS
ncbi:hypothetical protein [Mucilaginibacter segetis]|nr:hypothetical protein [Mucilaginibacter segetis]